MSHALLTDGENWLEVSCAPNYEVSDMGNFRRKDGKPISKWVTNHGYGQTQFNTKKKYATHRLNHKNGIKTDNRVENLEWCSRSHNMKHCFATGLLSIVGERHPSCRFKESEIIKIRQLRSQGKKYKEIAARFSSSVGTIGTICNRQTWKHI